MATKSNAPLVLFGLFGVGTVVLLAAAGGGSPVQGAQRVGGLVQGQIGRFFSWAELTMSSAAKRLGRGRSGELQERRAEATDAGVGLGGLSQRNSSAAGPAGGKAEGDPVTPKGHGPQRGAQVCQVGAEAGRRGVLSAAGGAIGTHAQLFARNGAPAQVKSALSDRF